MEMDELAKAFKDKPKKKFWPGITFIVGLVVLAASGIFLAAKLAGQSSTSDAEKLVEIGTFVKADEDGVIWHFTEIGKGSLTTNNHINDYDFIWVLENGKLKIETTWLYDLNNEYDYKLDGNELVLDDTIIFVPAAQED